MGINFDNVFNMHEKSLNVYGKRATILANNLANNDTPHFKARDIDFKSVLNDYATQLSNNANDTNNTMLLSEDFTDGALQYRIPMNSSLDGNTVDSEIEKAAFAENSTHYLASLSFMNQYIKSIMLAIRGE